MFEIELCTKDKNVIAKIYKLLLKFETEEQVEKCVIKWAIMFRYNIQIERWENM